MAGKGDKSRTKNTKQYRENFDAIDWREYYPFTFRLSKNTVAVFEMPQKNLDKKQKTQ